MYEQTKDVIRAYDYKVEGMCTGAQNTKIPL